MIGRHYLAGIISTFIIGTILGVINSALWKNMLPYSLYLAILIFYLVLCTIIIITDIIQGETIEKDVLFNKVFKRIGLLSILFCEFLLFIFSDTYRSGLAFEDNIMLCLILSIIFSIVYIFSDWTSKKIIKIIK